MVVRAACPGHRVHATRVEGWSPASRTARDPQVQAVLRVDVLAVGRVEAA